MTTMIPDTTHVIEPAADPDQLTEIFNLQSALQKKLGFDFSAMSMDEQIEFIRWNALAIGGEVSEALQEVGWKPWASARYIDREPFIGELVDVMKFWLNMLLVVGVTPEELTQRFRGKTVVNHRRHDDGYDGVSSKCNSCGRAADEPMSTT